eukprot:TRINITY_DN6707_c0_g1_i1.p1 TRINITY_DN6707_c0_g1~~TRINITY_DN6707_c0_g1_i1.p1  ORF type:complete len:1719 (+),score=643.18 TRINITY_DN6707_c0_g1_i1:90-5246(+)
MPHPFHVENTSTIIRLVKVLSPDLLKVLKARFLETEERKLDRERFHSAVLHALLQWATRQAQRDAAQARRQQPGARDDAKRAEDKAMEYIARDFGHDKQLTRSLNNLFDQLDADGDQRVDWLDVSNFIVEATITKQTIKTFNDRPEVREWLGIGSLPGVEVDRLVYIARWKKIVLCTQHKVVPVYTPPCAQHTAGALWAELVGHKASVMNASFIESIGRLATSSSDSTIIIWDEKQQCVLKQLPLPQPVLCMAAVRLNERSFLYTGGLDSATVSATTLREGAATSTHPSTIRGYDLEALLKWELDEQVGERGRERPLRHDEGDAGEEPASARRGQGSRRPWGWENPRKYPKADVRFPASAGNPLGPSHDDWVTDMVVIPDLRLLVSGSLDKTIRVWGEIDQPRSELRHTKLGHSKGVNSLCYVEDYRLLLSSGCGKELLVWNPFTPNPPLASLHGHEKQVISVCTFPNTPTCVSMEVTGRIIVWDLRSQSEVQNLGGPLSKYMPNPVTCFCLDTFEGQLIAIGKQMSWYRTKDTAHVHKMRQAITHILLNHRRQLVYVASGNKLYVYNSFDGTPAQTVERLGQAEITGLCWGSAEHDEIALGTADGKIRVVAENGQVLVSVAVSSGVAALRRMLSLPTGEGPAQRAGQRRETKLLLAVSLTGQVYLVDHTKANHPRHPRPLLQAHLGGPDAGSLVVRNTCFSPDKNLLVLFAGPPDETVGEGECVMEAWDLAQAGAPGDGTPVYGPERMTPAITAACMLDTQNCMLTCSTEGGLVFWNQHNFARMIHVQMLPVPAPQQGRRASHSPDAGDDPPTPPAPATAPFVAGAVAFNEACLAILAADEKRVKVIDFTWAAHKFFERHKDAGWNLVSVPQGRDVFRGRYVIERVLKGGWNVVKLGVDLRLNKRVALKTVHDLADFRNEVRVCEEVMRENSEFLIKMFDSWIDKTDKGEGPGHIVFECGDATLWEGLRLGTLPEAEARLVVGCITSGLADMHRAGYVHTDIKPKNIVRFGHLWKIIDLDCAQLVGDPMPLRFTPHYCPPEMGLKRLTGQRLPAACSLDVWSYGAVVFELVTRQKLLNRYLLHPGGDAPPAISDDAEVGAIINFLTASDAQERLRRRIAFLQETEPVVHQVVSNCLQIDPKKRWTLEMCRELLVAEGYARAIVAAPMELRPFPPTVPADVPLLCLTEPVPEAAPKRQRQGSAVPQEEAAEAEQPRGGDGGGTPDAEETPGDADGEGGAPAPNAGAASFSATPPAEQEQESGRGPRWGTIDTRCTQITALALHEYPHAVVVADHDAYAHNAVLRVYATSHRYHGRLPTNDYDDTDVNWHFPLQSADMAAPPTEAPGAAQPQPGSPARGGGSPSARPGSAKGPRAALQAAGVSPRSACSRSPPPAQPQQLSPSGGRPQPAPLDLPPEGGAPAGAHSPPPEEEEEGEMLVNTPRTLLKTYSWNTLKNRLDERAGRPRREAQPGTIADRISPFFAEWKRSGASYEPVQAFYQVRRRNSLEEIQLEQRRAARRALRGAEREATGQREPPPVGRDLDFLKASPRPSPLVNPFTPQLGHSTEDPASPSSPGQRHGAARSSRRDIAKLTRVRIQGRQGELTDALLWTQPPKRRFVGSDGQRPPWVVEADRILNAYMPKRSVPKRLSFALDHDMDLAASGSRVVDADSEGEDDEEEGDDVYGGVRIPRSATAQARRKRQQQQGAAGSSRAVAFVDP